MKKIQTVADVSAITVFVFFISAEIIAEAQKKKEKRDMDS